MDGQTADKSSWVAECKYKESDRLLTEQFIGRLHNDDMTGEILGEVKTLENTEESTIEHVLSCAHRLEVQSAKRSELNSIKEARDFGVIWQNSQKQAQGCLIVGDRQPWP